MNTLKNDDARKFALAHHGDQMYGDKPYSYHLDAVAKLVSQYSLAHEGEEKCALDLAYLHDVVEDTYCTLSKIESHFGTFVRDCVHLLTDEPGANRKARKKATYAKLKAVPLNSPLTVAHVVKACDRMANLAEALSDRNKSILSMYAAEDKAFSDCLYGRVPTQVRNALEGMMVTVRAVLA